MSDQDKTREQLISENEELRRREARWRSIVVNTPLFVCLVDRAGTIQYLNRTVPGIAMEDAIGRSTYDFIEPAHWEIARQCIERVFDTGQPAFYEVISAGPNGSRSWYETSVGPVKAGDQVVAVTLIATDITRRKHAEDVLAEREARLLEAQEVASLGFYVLDLATGRFTTSSVLDRIFGIPAEYERSVDGWANLVHPDERPEMLDYFLKEVAKEKHPFDREYRIVRYGDKQVRWVHGLGRLQFNEDGQPVSMLGTIQDITERKQAEEALQKAHDELERRVEERTAELRASTERYELAVRGAGVGIWDWDIRTGKLYFSPRWKAIFGYGENDIGDSLDDWARLLHPDETDWMLKFLEDFLAGTSPTVTVEYRLRHKDGSYRWIAAHGLVVRDDQGKAIRLVGSHGDITDRKQAEEALRQSHDELRAIYGSLGDGLLVADRATLRLVRANASICSMLGYSEEELLSMSIANLHPKEALSVIVETLRDEIVGHLPNRNNAPMLRKDGSIFYVDITGDTFIYQGRPCTLGVFRDVTERRQAQAALERERRTLKHMLEASDHERQLIAYDIHDGLAQDLAGAIMQFQIYAQARQANPKDAAKVFDSAMTMLQQSHAEARRLISGVRPPILDESGVVAAIVHLVYDPAFEQGPKIDFRNRVKFKRLAPILENVIYRVVQEGLSNARNHSKSKEILVSLKQRDDRLRIEIRDWGVGFDPKIVKDGHFGLEGIRERARLLGGKCNIKSTPGEGTSIVVELPVVERESEQQ